MHRRTERRRGLDAKDGVRIERRVRFMRGGGDRCQLGACPLERRVRRETGDDLTANGIRRSEALALWRLGTQRQPHVRYLGTCAHEVARRDANHA